MVCPLFAVEIMYYFIDKLKKTANILICIVCACIGAFMIDGPYPVLKLMPWSWESAFASISFYCFGNMLTKKFSLNEIKSYIIEKNILFIVLIIIITPILFFLSHWNGHISLGTGLMGKHPVVFYINALLGIVDVFIFAVLFCSINFRTHAMQLFNKWLLFFGKNSFYVMATHIPVRAAVILITVKLLHSSNAVVTREIIPCTLICVITCVICSVLAVFIQKLKNLQISNKRVA